MWIDLEIVSVTQWAREQPTTVMPWLSVGSTHFDEGTVQPDGSIVYDLLNLWLQYEVRVPRRCKGLRFQSNFKRTFNDDSWIVPQVYGWSLGTAEAPGVRNPFKWDVLNKTSGIIEADIEMPAGINWLWLTYNYAGQGSGYVAEVTMELLQGEALGPGRIYVDGVLHAAVPHICKDGIWRPAESQLCKTAVWHPTA